MSDGRPNVFGVSRDLWEHPLFADDEVFSEREAWAWLIGAAAWKELNTKGNSGPLRLKRSEFSFSVRFLMRKWRWENKDRVHRFMKRLEKHDMIRDTSRDKSQVYSILNYNRFQVVGVEKRDSNSDTTATAPRQHRDKEETGETGKQVIEQPEPPAKAGVLIPGIVSRETKSSTALVVVQSLPDWLPLEAWSAYLEMRRKKRAAPTPRAIELLLKRLEKWVQAGHDPTEILDTSTRSNWTDIYEPKDGKNGTSRHRPPTANDKNLAGAALAIASYGTDDEQRRQAETHSDAGGPVLPLLDARLHTRAGGGTV